MHYLKTVTVMLLCCGIAQVSCAQTEVLLYNAFGNSPKQVTLSPAKATRGECLSRSRLSPRDDAWRCIAGAKIHDPCYVRTFVKRNEVICPQVPWQASAVTILLGRELPQPRETVDAFKQAPWIMELADGQKCILSNAQGKQQYICSNHDVINSRLQRCKGTWKVLVQNPSGAQSQLKPVEKVWY